MLSEAETLSTDHPRRIARPPAPRAASAPPTVEVITTRGGLQRYADRWNDLVAASDHPTPFASWEWIDAWLDSVGQNGRLLAVIVADARGELLGAAAFAPVTLRLVGLIPYRCLRYLGDLDSGGEYPQILIRRECEALVEPLIAAALAARRDWDCLWLPNVAEWTGAAARFRRLAAAMDLRVRERPVDFGARPLPVSGDDFEQSISGNLQSTLKRQRRKLASAGCVELFACERSDEIAPLLNALFDLHARRRGSIGDAGCFVRYPRMRRFYERFAPAALKRGWLRLFGARIDGVIRAVQYGYVYQDTFYQLQEGFDPDAPAGIGNVLRAHVINTCIAQGVRAYDFLGEFTEHKRRWGAAQRFGCDMFLCRGSLKNRLLSVRPLWPTGRFLRADGAPRPTSTRSAPAADRGGKAETA